MKRVRVVLEPSGGYEQRLPETLHRQKIQASVVNPYYVRNFARSYQDLAKTDKIDAKMLSEYGERSENSREERRVSF